jgi:hypothetical protein
MVAPGSALEDTIIAASRRALDSVKMARKIPDGRNKRDTPLRVQ